MATTTPKYGLTKPELNDFYDIAVHNDNMDKVEAALTGHDKSLESHDLELKRQDAALAGKAALDPDTGKVRAEQLPDIDVSGQIAVHNADGAAHAETMTKWMIPTYREVEVATTGSDETGDGSRDRPFRTIQHAVNSLPHYVSYTSRVYIAPGFYDEDVALTEFFGGSINLMRRGDSGTVSVRSLFLRYCHTAQLYFLTIHGETPTPEKSCVYMTGCGNVTLYGFTCTATGSTDGRYGAIACYNTSAVYIDNSTISNKRIALDCMASTVYLSNSTTGTNNVTAIRCGSGWGGKGGIVLKGGASIAGAEETSYSGQIF